MHGNRGHRETCGATAAATYDEPLSEATEMILGL